MSKKLKYLLFSVSRRARKSFMGFGVRTSAELLRYHQNRSSKCRTSHAWICEELREAPETLPTSEGFIGSLDAVV
jgi:hypothetical protein